MSNCIITIGRQYGAGGREIAEKLAKQLQIPLYDRKLVAFISAHLEKGVSLDELDLTYDNLYGSVSPYETMFADLNVEDDNYLFTPQSKAIKALAEKNSGIFVGRCANFILKDVKNAHHFFICHARRPQSQKCEKPRIAEKNRGVKVNLPPRNLEKSKNAEYICTPKCGSSSVVEHQLPKLRVAGSTPVSRS